jgi:S-adenosylhomocysteine hydrolase
VYVVPERDDESIAELKLKSMSISIDNLTDEQKKVSVNLENGTT